MSFADLLDSSRSLLIERWLERAVPLAPRALGREELIDSLPAFLDSLSAAFRREAGAPVASSLPAQSPIAQAHGQQRLRLGYDLPAVAREYNLLHDCILSLLEDAGLALSTREHRLLTECLGTAAADSLWHFAAERDGLLRQIHAEREQRLAEAEGARARAEAALAEGRKAEADARAARDLLSAVLQQMPAAIFIAEAPSGRVVLGNRRISELMGEPMRETASVSEYTQYKGFHPDGRPLAPEEWPLARSIQRGETVEGEEVIVERRDGTRRVFQLSSAPVRDGEGRIVSAVVTLTDITARRQVEAALRRSEARLRRLVESGLLGVVTFTLDGRITEANDAFLQMLGYDRADLETGRLDWKALTPPEFQAASEYAERELKAHGIVRPFEKQYFRKDGSRVDILLGGAMLSDSPDEGIAFHLDITARKQREQLQAQLAASEARLRVTFEQAAVGMAELTVAGRWARVNQKLCDILGYPPEELRRLTFQDVTHPEDLAADLALLERLVRGDIPSYAIEKRYRRKDGDLVWVRLTASVVRGQGGAPERFIAVIEDISERRRAEEARERIRALLEAVLEQLPVGVLIAEAPSGRLVLGNRQVERILGYRLGETETVFEYAARARVYHPDGRRFQPRELALMRSLEHGELVVGDAREVERPDGTRRAISVSATPVRGADGRIIASVAIIEDITRRKEQEAEARMRADFERQLIGIVSHDLRSPIAAITMSASVLLRRKNLDERQAQVMGRILSSAERAGRMIRDLLDFTQARLGGGIRIARTPLDLHEFVRQVVDEVRLAHPERRFELTHEGDGRGEWDADRLAQVLTNLVSNAVAYSPPDSAVEIRTRGLDGEVMFEVHNTGAPIPADQLPRLFQPLERGDPRQGASDRSIGLGLYIVRQLVSAHGGTIQVTSDERGTLFSVRIPRHGAA